MLSNMNPLREKGAEITDGLPSCQRSMRAADLGCKEVGPLDAERHGHRGNP